MKKNNTIILEVKTDTTNLDKGTQKIEKTINQTKGKTNDLSGSFGMLQNQVGAFGGGAVTAFRSALAGARTLTAGMKTLKGAIVSTGIGAVVLAVVAMIQAVSRLQVVQDKWKVATAGLSAVLDVLLDNVAYIGEAIINAFSEDPLQALKDFGALLVENIYNRVEGLVMLLPSLGEALMLVFKGEFSEAGEVAANALLKVTTGVENLATKLTSDEAKAYAAELLLIKQRAEELARAEQQLEDLRISQTITQARRSKQIAEARLLAEDELLTFEEREEALKSALELETQSLAERLANAKEEARLIAERNKLSESSRADRKAEADAAARVFELEEASLKQQKRIFTELQSLQKQKEAQQAKEIADAEKAAQELVKIQDELYKATLEVTLSNEEKELMANEEKYNKLLDQAAQYNLDTTELEEAREIESKKIRDKFRKEREDADKESNKKIAENEKQLQDVKMTLAKNSLSLISGIAEAFAGEDEARARKAFNVSKAVNASLALLNTFQGVTTALAGKGADGLLPFPIRLGNAIVAGTTGLLQVAKIKNTQFEGGGGGNLNVPSSGGGGATPQIPQQPQVDFGFLQQGENQNTIQAYVLEQNVSSSQQANQLIKDQAVL